MRRPANPAPECIRILRSGQPGDFPVVEGEHGWILYETIATGGYVVYLPANPAAGLAARQGLLYMCWFVPCRRVDQLAFRDFDRAARGRALTTS